MILAKILFRAFFIAPAMIIVFTTILRLLGLEDYTAFNIAGCATVIIVSIISIKDIKEM